MKKILRMKDFNLIFSKMFFLIALFSWAVYAFFYIYFKKHLALNISGYFSLLGEVGLDIILVMLSFFLWRKSSAQKKTFFLFFFVSFLLSIISDFSYNFLLNIRHIELTHYVDSIFDIPFLFFLVLQAVAWSFISITNLDLKKDKFVNYLPYFFAALVMFFIFIFMHSWKIQYFSLIGIYQILDTFFEIIGFCFAMFCLIRGNCFWLKCLSTGYLTVVGSDLIIRYSVIKNNIMQSNLFEVTWVLGLLLIVIGLYSAINKLEEKDSLLPVNSLQSQLSVWSFTLLLTSIFLVYLMTFILSHFYMSTGVNTIEYYPSIIIFISIISATASNYFSMRLSKPLNIISEKIKLIELNSLNLVEKNKTEFGIKEIEELDDFVLSVVSKLTDANNVKTEFIMNMSHDFRTPASGIYHMSKFMYERMDDNSVFKKHQKLIVNSSQQLLGFIDNILDYAQFQNQDHKFELQEFCVVQLIDGMLALMSAKIKEKGLTTNAQYSNTSNNYLGNKLLINRVILNVVSNAIKFTHNGGIYIYVSEEKTQIQNYLVIKIRDTGIGIDEKNTSLIFEPFFRVESAETGSYSGVGLGLSCVNVLLKKIGGKINVSSQLGIGSVFTILIPIIFRQ